MARHSSLSIYKVTYDLLRLVTEATKHFPRDFKQSLGKDLRDDTARLIKDIYRANSAADKVPHLGQLLERLQEVELALRLSRDMRFISVSQYGDAIELTNMAGRQANGWKNYERKRQSSPVA